MAKASVDILHTHLYVIFRSSVMKPLITLQVCVFSKLFALFLNQHATSRLFTNYFNFLATGQCSPGKPSLKKDLPKFTIKTLGKFCGGSTVTYWLKRENIIYCPNIDTEGTKAPRRQCLKEILCHPSTFDSKIVIMRKGGIKYLFFPASAPPEMV